MADIPTQFGPYQLEYALGAGGAYVRSESEANGFTRLFSPRHDEVQRARAILDDPSRHAAITAELREVRRRLGRGGAADRAATIAVEMMGAGPA